MHSQADSSADRSLNPPIETPIEAIADSLSPAEAFAAITVIAISSDGYLATEELDTLTMSLARMHLFRSMSAEEMRRLHNKLFDLMRSLGADRLLEKAKIGLPVELRESAFAIATDLVLSDGLISQEETAFLNALHHALEIDPETGSKILEVMMIKNRG